jgi:putative acetyltransferase
MGCIDRIELIEVTTLQELSQVRALFCEYAQLHHDARCKDTLSLELANLSGFYEAPRGSLFLALVAGMPAGCVGLRPTNDGACEMRRLYVRPAYRGAHLGRMLVEAVMVAARERGYRLMRLQTVPEQMPIAVNLYRQLGFAEQASPPMDEILTLLRPL